MNSWRRLSKTTRVLMVINRSRPKETCARAWHTYNDSGDILQSQIQPQCNHLKCGKACMLLQPQDGPCRTQMVVAYGGKWYLVYGLEQALKKVSFNVGQWRHMNMLLAMIGLCGYNALTIERRIGQLFCVDC